jgi:hypothetical protein
MNRKIRKKKAYLPSANSVFPTNAIVPIPLPAIDTRWSSRYTLPEAILETKWQINDEW